MTKVFQINEELLDNASKLNHTMVGFGIDVPGSNLEFFKTQEDEQQGTVSIRFTSKAEPYSNSVKAEIARLDRRSTYLEGLIINSAHQSYENSDELQKEFVSKVDYVNFIIRTVPRP